MSNTPTKPIKCPFCYSTGGHEYIKAAENEGLHFVRCNACHCPILLSEQELQAADPGFEAWCEARDDERTERQNNHFRGQWK